MGWTRHEGPGQQGGAKESPASVRSETPRGGQGHGPDLVTRSPSASRRSSVLVIGGGSAGLTAALRLSESGRAVTLLDRTGELGGRLLTPPGPSRMDEEPTETLPAVLMGWQEATLRLLASLGTDRAVGGPTSSRLTFQSQTGRIVALPRPICPGPAGPLLTVLGFRGLSWPDRWRLLATLERAWEGDPPLPADLETRSADGWLAQCGQSEAARAGVWNSLSRFLLGNDLADVSAGMLVRVLTRAFLKGPRGSRVWVPSSGYWELLIGPARAALERAGAALRPRDTAAQLRFEGQRVSGVRLESGETLTADWYVLALPPRALTPLLPDSVMTHFAYFQQAAKLPDSPALVVHLRLEPAPGGPRLVLLAGRTFHWLVARPAGDARTSSSAVCSLVAAGRWDLLDLPDQALRDAALAEARRALALPATVTARSVRVVLAPHAFVSVRPGVSTLRPLQQSPFANLVLAGDWTDTGLPATLESAILSGERCVQVALGSLPRA